MQEYVLVLGLSVVALAVSALALLRNPPGTLRRMSEEALDRATKVEMSNTAALAELQSILGSIQDERERTQKAGHRARAERQRAEQASGGNAGIPITRDEQLIDLRKRAGLV